MATMASNAPNAPNVPNTVSFGNVAQTMIAPDLLAEQLRLSRQQQIADYLRQQALSSVDQQTVTGAGPTRVVPINRMQGVAKVVQAFLGAQNQNQIDQRTLGMAKEMAQRYATALRGDVPPTADAAPPQGPPDAAPAPTDAPPPAQVDALQVPLQAPVDGAPDTAPQVAPVQAAPQTPMTPQIVAALRGNAAAPAPDTFGLANLLRGSMTEQLGGDAAGKAYWDRFKLTDASRLAQQGNMDPVQTNRLQFIKDTTDPKILAMRQSGMNDQQIYGAVFGEAAKNAEIERKAGNQFVNSMTDASGQVPHMPPNTNPVGPIAPNGAIPGGVVPMAGAIPAVQATAQAQAAGTAGGGLHVVKMPDGREVPVRGSEIGPGGTLLPPPQAGVNGNFEGDPAAIAAAIPVIAQHDPQGAANVQAALAEQARRTPGFAQGAPLKLGQSTADKATQDAGAKLMTELPMQLAQSKQTVTGLENAYKTIDAVGKSGPGVSKTVNALAVLNNMGISLLKDDTNGYQTLKKFLENSASTAAASNGFTGSDARFEQFKAGQPNAESMNPDALKGAIRYVLSQHDASIARAQFIQNAAQQNQGDPNAVQKAAQQFSQTYNPRVFEFSRMTPPERAQTKSGMSAEQRQKFGQQYNLAHEQGWVQ